MAVHEIVKYQSLSARGTYLVGPFHEFRVTKQRKTVDQAPRQLDT